VREADQEFYDKLMARALVKRGAAYAWLSQFDESIKDFMTILKDPTYAAILGERDIASLQKDLAVVQNRQASQRIKQEGDWEFYKERFDEAMVKYQEALQEDKENEYAISNIGLIHLKQAEYAKCIEASNQALAIIDNFQNETKSFQAQNSLEVKILLRRAKCFENTGDMEKAKADLDKILLLEPQNSEARSMLKIIQVKLDDVTFNMYLTQANDLLKQRQFQQALDLYDKCLKVTRKATTLDNISVYVNKVACLLSQDRFEKVITECNEAVRLIRNYKNRFTVKGGDAERLKQMELRVSVRRGNALAKLQRVSEAIAEYERALQIEPN